MSPHPNGVWASKSVRKQLESYESVVIHCWLFRFAGFLMWTKENRGRYDRCGLRYPSDLTEEEWALICPLIPPAKRGGNKRTVDVRQIVNGLLYILSTGCQWRALPQGPAAQELGQRLFASLG